MKFSNEARVGLVIIFSFTVFIVFVAVLTEINITRTGYELRIYYGFLDDLRPGAPVKIAGGIPIGRVRSIEHSGDKTEVTVWIEKEYRLSKSTKFGIFTSGLIGEKYINVLIPPMRTDEDYLEHGDIVYGMDPASFDQMMLTFQSFFYDESGGEILAQIFQSSRMFVENLSDITYDNKDDIRRTISMARMTMSNLSRQTETLMKELNRLSNNMADLSEQNKEDFAITMRNISEITENMNKIVYRLEQGRGTVGKLLTEEEVYDNIHDASVSAKELFDNLKRDPSQLFFQK